MRKRLWMITGLAFWLLSACSALDQVNNTVTYVAEATDYANKATAFAQEVPALAEQAVSNQQAAEELAAKMQGMKEEIEQFNELQSPEIAAELHQQIVMQNNKVAEGIDLYLNDMQDGTIDLQLLENVEVLQPIQEIASIVNQIKNLGQ